MTSGQRDAATAFETRQADWLSVDAALGRVLAAAVPCPPESAPLSAALGRILAEPVDARATLPPWDNSAMDGYAVLASDVRGAEASAPVSLRVVGSIRPGPPSEGQVAAGQAMRIMTGAPVPRGADSVVRVEDTDRERTAPGHVHILADRDAGRNVRPAGQDMRPGERVLDAGDRLGPGQLALCAAAGAAAVRVHRPPRVAVLSSGDELRTVEAFDDVLRGAGIPETNGVALAAAAQAAGAAPLPTRIARDLPDSIREHVEASLDADVLLTTGGASMGEADLFKRVLDGMGFELSFWRVTLRPGSPTSFGFLRRPDRGPLPVFGLPGNPASAFVTFELFVRPFLLRAAGHRRVHRPVVRAVSGSALPGSGRLTHFHRVRLAVEDGQRVARLTGPQGSGLVQSLGRAQGLAVVPRGASGIGEGDAVDVMVIDDAWGATEAPAFRADVG